MSTASYLSETATDETNAPLTVTGLQVDDHGTTLQTAQRDHTSVVLEGCHPDVDAAQARLTTTRRINRVEVLVNGSGAKARLHGKRSRLPFVVDLPLRVALGLTALGVRTTVMGYS